MKRRELLVGIVLAAALIAAIVWTRGTGVGGAEGLPVALDLTDGDGELSVEDVTVAVTAGPRPLRVFDSLRFDFRFERAGEPVSVTEPRIGFEMTMDMGPHDYRLVRGGAGHWVAGGVVLPQCGSGSRLWFGDLAFEVDGRAYAARLQLKLHPPR